MKRKLVLVLAMFLAACGADEASKPAAGSTPAEASQNAPPAQASAVQSDVTDERIGMPAYPGATEVEYSRVKLQSDIGDSFSVAYQTSDSPAQVAAFYQAEAAKLGTLQESISTGEQLKSVSVDRTDGSQSAIKAMTDGKGATIITVHRFFPAK